MARPERWLVELPAEDAALVVWWSKVQKKRPEVVIAEAVASHFAPFKNNPNLKYQYGSKP